MLIPFITIKFADKTPIIRSNRYNIIYMKLHPLWALAFGAVLLTGCDAYKKVPYFQDLQANPEAQIVSIPMQALTIQPGDKLSVVVSSARTPDQAAQFNLPLSAQSVGFASYGNNNVMPYYVDTKGNIDFPVLGKIRVAGLTREALANEVKTALVKQQLLRDAVVTVEMLNQYVNVLGEVNRPGRVNIDRDNLTLLEAISQCGDLTIYGERNQVWVLRQEGNKQVPYRVDLSNAEQVYASPVYQLKQNDVIYVQPNITKQRQSLPWANSWQNPSIYISITSVLMSVAVLVVNLVRK